MAEKLPSFLRRDGDSLLFNNESGYFAFYVPELYFGKENIAMIMGDYINLIGILDYTIFNDDGTNIGLKPFKFPTIFLTQPGEVEKIKNVKLTKYTKEQDYRVLKYYYGDTIVVSTKVPQDSQNIEQTKLKHYLYAPHVIVHFTNGIVNNMDIKIKVIVQEMTLKYG